MDVRERLHQLMDERGWTIYKVAQEADIPWSTLRNMFKRGTDPSIATLESICHGMGITLSQFFDETNVTDLTEEQRDLIRVWSRLSEHDKALVQELVKTLDIRKSK